MNMGAFLPIELNSSHPSRPGAQERLGLRRRITSFATGAPGHDEVIPRAMHVRARHRWPCRTRVSCDVRRLPVRLPRWQYSR
jgi:hypothetical protein